MSEVYSIHTKHILEINKMYGDEIQFLSIRIMTSDVILTYSQVLELNAIGIFPRRIDRS